jgi:hypothetical protein
MSNADTKKRSPEEERQIHMFGCTVAQMVNEPLFTNMKDPSEVILYAMSILSDTQETLAHGNAEQARQFINKSKYFMSEARDLLRQPRESEELEIEGVSPSM